MYTSSTRSSKQPCRRVCVFSMAAEQISTNSRACNNSDLLSYSAVGPFWFNTGLTGLKPSKSGAVFLPEGAQGVVSLPSHGRKGSLSSGAEWHCDLPLRGKSGVSVMDSGIQLRSFPSRMWKVRWVSSCEEVDGGKNGPLTPGAAGLNEIPSLTKRQRTRHEETHSWKACSGENHQGSGCITSFRTSESYTNVPKVSDCSNSNASAHICGVRSQTRAHRAKQVPTGLHSSPFPLSAFLLPRPFLRLRSSVAPAHASLCPHVFLGLFRLFHVQAPLGQHGAHCTVRDNLPTLRSTE